jgi:hypothetical protein
MGIDILGRTGITEARPSALSGTHTIEVKEAYRNYIPPLDALAIVQELLRTVPDKYLTGLDCVVLTNEILSRRDRVGKVWSRKRKFDKSSVLGRYHGRSRNSSPYIELRVDRIIFGLNRLPSRIPMLRDIVFGHVLFHEIGHHIHRTVRPEYDEKEDVADKWAGKLNRNFVRKKYWYALPILIPALKFYKLRRKQWV